MFNLCGGSWHLLIVVASLWDGYVVAVWILLIVSGVNLADLVCQALRKFFSVDVVVVLVL